MKKIAISILLAIVVALPLMAYTPQEAVNKFVSHSSLRYASLGVQVIDLDSARSIASYRPEQANITASTMKTVVSSAALGLLGPHFRFETPVYLDGELKDGTFKGDIIIRGLGDPTIGSVFLPCQANIVQEIIDALGAKIDEELTQSAVVVLSASLIIAVVVWLMDVGFKAVMSSIYPN